MKGAAAIDVAPMDGAAAPQDALVRRLDDLTGVLLRLSGDGYRATPLPGVSGSIGRHVRHVLDHVSAFVNARPYGTMTYDTRERGTSIESDRGAAIAAILRLTPLLRAVTDRTLDSPVVVTSVTERGGRPQAARSTLRRELAFVVDHTVHHQALIAVLLSIAGERVPDEFGLAPSTPRPARS